MFEEMLLRFAYDNPPPIPRPRAWPSTRRILSSSPPADSIINHNHNHNQKEVQNAPQRTQYSDTLLDCLGVIPPCFQDETDSKKKIEKKKEFDKTVVRVVSPYFPAPPNEEEKINNNLNSMKKTKETNKKKEKKKRALKAVVSPYFKYAKEEDDVKVNNVLRVVSPYFPNKEEEHHEKRRKKKKKNRIKEKENDPSLEHEIPIVISPYFTKEESEGKTKRHRKKKDINNSSDHWVVSPYFLKDKDQKMEKIVKVASNLSDEQPKQKKKRARTTDDEEGLEPEGKTKRHRKKKDISNSSGYRVVSPYFLKDKDQKKEKIIKVAPNLSDEQPKQKTKRARTTDDEEGRDAKPIKKTRTRKSVVLTSDERKKDAYRRRDDSNTWIPPRSTHGLLQEYHYHDPWRVLVICILLNVTSGTQVKQVIDDFFEVYPDARAASEADQDTMKEIIKSLGLKNKRTEIIKRMSKEYLEDDWTHVTQLYGVGKYAADAYAIFCNGKWNEVAPQDHKLEDYWAFMNSVADSLR